LSRHRIVEVQNTGIARSEFYAEPGMSGSPILGIQLFYERLISPLLDCNGNLIGMIRGAQGQGPLFRVDFLTVGRIAEVAVSAQLVADVRFKWR
jgi:hypothetical protein